MGQIFYATIYRLDTLEYVRLDADKFHANCYSFSGVVKMMHHYLRKGAWSVCYCGGSARLTVDDFKSKTVDPLLFALFEHGYIHQTEEGKEIVGEVNELFSRWKNIYDTNDWPFEPTSYKGFLINHDKKEAVDLTDYTSKSVCASKDKGGYYAEYCVDPIPVLTENPESINKGMMMLFFDGCTSDTTEELSGTWSCDSLEIVDALPEGYTVINCVFSEARSKMYYNYDVYGVNADDMILCKDGSLFGMVKLRIRTCTRGKDVQYIKAVRDGEYINYNGIFVDDFGKVGNAETEDEVAKGEKTENEAEKNK